MVLMPETDASRESLGSVTLSCGTDNQGNMFLLDKLLTTKYPLGVVLMELASQLGRRAATLRADWIPRLQNEEADALTNWDFRHFDLDRRVEVDLDSLGFMVMNDLFDAGEAYLTELEDLKTSSKAGSSSSASDPKRKRTKAERDWGAKGAKFLEQSPW